MRLWPLFLLGCGNPAPEAGDHFAVPLVAQAAPGDEVVATVDGRPIHASQVAAQARAAGTGAKEALAALIDAEALAGEAARRGLDRDRDAEEAAQAEAVRRLLQTGFERQVTAAEVPATLVRKVYERNRSQLDHELEIDVWHILVPTRGLDGEKLQAARAVAQALGVRARKVNDVEAFKALAATIPGARYEHVVTERDGWTLKEFSHPAFEQLHKPGDVSSVIETSYGFHVLYLVALVPPRHTTLQDADAELRKGVLPEFQKQEFIHWTDRLAGAHQITVHREKLK